MCRSVQSPQPLPPDQNRKEKKSRGEKKSFMEGEAPKRDSVGVWAERAVEKF